MIFTLLNAVFVVALLTLSATLAWAAFRSRD
jgi:hypothetical protein